MLVAAMAAAQRTMAVIHQHLAIALGAVRVLVAGSPRATCPWRVACSCTKPRCCSWS
jgi:hypothetical protein